MTTQDTKKTKKSKKEGVEDVAQREEITQEEVDADYKAIKDYEAQEKAARVARINLMKKKALRTFKIKKLKEDIKMLDLKPYELFTNEKLEEARREKRSDKPATPRKKKSETQPEEPPQPV